MARLRRTLMFVLMLALILPAWTAAGAAQAMTTEQKYEVLKEKGIFTGFDDGSARLDAPMTREQFAAVLFRLWGLTEENPAKATYYDVLRTRWSFGEVEAITKAGLMNGTGKGKFSPATNVTIEQLAVVLIRAYGYSGSGIYVTGKVSAYARESVGIALSKGYIPPQTNYTVAATRALLVEAAYAAYVQIHGNNDLDVKSVQPISNNVIQVTLNRAVKDVDLSHFSLSNEWGNTVSILWATLSSDGKTVTLTTSSQIGYLIHTLKIDGDAWRYTSLPAPSTGNGNGNGDTTRPYIVSLTNSEEQQLKVTFSEQVNKSSATDPDNYDITSGDLDLLSFQLSSDNKTVYIATSRQQQGTTYRMSIHGVKDLSGNVMTARSDLYFTGIDDRSKPTVVSVASQNANTVKVVFSEKVDTGDARDTRNYQITYVGQNNKTSTLRINRATLADDGKTVTLSTNDQWEGQSYKLTIRGIADLSGNVIDTKSFTFAYDRTKPYVTSVDVLENSVLRVKFSEKVNESQAENRGNYSIDNGLSIISAYLEDGGDSVLLTTAKQKDAVLYRLTVKGISDLSGNMMDTQSDLYFGGLVDNTPPTVTSVTAGAKKIVLTFSERLDSSTANRAGNYRVNGNLSVTGAQYDDAKRTVTISTGNQTPGSVYTLTINNVKDLSGLPIEANTSLQFVGVASDSGAIALQTIGVIDQNTVQLTFSRALYDEDVRQLDLAIIKDNGSNLSNNGWESYVSRKSGTDNVVTVQFRTDRNDNPSLFLGGHTYVGKVTGINGLVTDNDANQQRFAGTSTTNKAPTVTQAKALNKGAVQVTFSEPVRNVGPEGFRLFRDDGDELSIRSDSLNDRGRIVTDVVLYLDDELQSGHTYQLKPQASITDAAGWNAIQATSTVFAGTNSADAAPRINQVTSVDRYTFSISFSEPVQIGDENGFTLYDSTDREDVNIDKNGYAEFVPSADRKTLTVYLNAETGQILQSGKRYVLRLDTEEGRITDDQGNSLQGASDSGTIELAFTSNGKDKSGPAISKVEARGSLILVTFNEAITGYSNQTDFFDIKIAGRDVRPASGSLQGQTVVLKVSALTSGQIGTIRVSSEGQDAIRDYNRLAPSTDEVVFGVQ